MNDLRPLHALLQHIGRRRRRLRGLIGVSGIIVAVSAAWLGLFALDWGLQLGRMERAVAVLLAAVALGWAVRKLVLPWWMSRETELHLALLLQKRAGIDTDLVAALQFEAAEAGRWGSPELQAAVMRRVATATPTLPLREDIPPRIVGRRVIVAALALASVTSVALVFPKHTCVFLDRLLLRSAAYPTATRIDEIRIAGQPVRLDRSPAEVRCPLGAAVDFRVTVSGRVPQEGLVQLSAVEARQSSRLPLLPESGTAGTFTASLPLLTDDSECRIRIGDASTGPIVLSPVHPLQARLVFEIREPDYGDGTDRIRRRQEGILQLTVPEGSWVRPWLVSDRRLSRAELHFGDDVTALRRVAEPPPASDATENPAPNDGRTGRPHGAAPAYWWTPEPIPTALGDVTEPVRLEFVMEEEADSHGAWRCHGAGPSRVRDGGGSRFLADHDSSGPSSASGPTAANRRGITNLAGVAPGQADHFLPRRRRSGTRTNRCASGACAAGWNRGDLTYMDIMGGGSAGTTGVGRAISFGSFCDGGGQRRPTPGISHGGGAGTRRPARPEHRIDADHAGRNG